MKQTDLKLICSYCELKEKHSEIILQITNNLFESEKRKFNDDSMTTLSDSDQSENDYSEDEEASFDRLDK